MDHNTVDQAVCLSFFRCHIVVTVSIFFHNLKRLSGIRRKNLVQLLFGFCDLVSYDLVFAHLVMPKGAALLGMLLLGWILGGLLVWLFVVQPLKRRLARTRRQLRAQSEDDTDPATA